MSNLEQNKFIRKLVIIALFADDLLMNKFFLKGGNALDIIYKISDRASIDIDVSMIDEFSDDELEDMQSRLERAFEKVFSDHNLLVFDLKLKSKPKEVFADIKEYWGGYSLVFKIIDKEKAVDMSLASMQKQALTLGPKNSTNFKVDISKFEYCKPCTEATLDDYTIYVYTPIMIVFEKLRAICQQMPEYAEKVHLKARPRARDFYDIYTTINKLKLEDLLLSNENIDIFRAIFAVKHVPVEILSTIEDSRELHKGAFQSVMDTVSNIDKEKDFDFYFNYILNLVERLKPFWKE